MEENKNVNTESNESPEESTRRKILKKHKESAMVWFFVIAASILFYFLLEKIPFLMKILSAILSATSPLIVGFALAFLLNPMVMFFEKHFLKFYHKHRKGVDKITFAEHKRKRQEKKIAKAQAATIASGGKEHVVSSDDNAGVTNQNTFLVDGRKGARRLSIFVTVLITLTSTVLLLMAVIPAFTESVTRVAENVPVYAEKINKTVTNVINDHKWIKKQVPDTQALLKRFDVTGLITDLLGKIVSHATDWIFTAIKIIYNIVIGLVVAIYLLGGKERYIGQIKKSVFAIMKPATAKKFVQSMHGTNEIFKSAILGKILDSICIGCLCFIGTSILGLVGFEAIGNNNVLISVIVGITNIIPFFGPYIGAIPCIFLVLCEDPVDALVFAIFILCLQQFDCNFLDPRIVGKSVGLSPIYVLASCITCGGLFGILGMVIAVPTGAITYGLLKSTFESRLEAKNMPKETQAYAKIPGAYIYRDSLENENKAEETK